MLKVRIVIVFILLTVCCSLSAQPLVRKTNKKELGLNLLDYEYGNPLHFGYSVGINVFSMNSFTMKNYPYQPDVVTVIPGFHVNAIVGYRLLPNLNIQSIPGISYASRKVYLYDQTFSESKLMEEVPPLLNEIFYFEVPLYFKYSAKRLSNFRPYIIGGFNFKFDITSLKDALKAPEVDVLKYQRPVDPYAEIGFGFDIYVNNYFRMSLEVKFSKALIPIKGKDMTVKTLDPDWQPVWEDVMNHTDMFVSDMFVFSIHFR